MKIDATRYKLFQTNPEEYRLRECWNLIPAGGGQPSYITFGRRRGTAFHELTEGNTPAEQLGETAISTAEEMHEANKKFEADTTVLWREREFDIAIPDSPHRMVGRVDSLVTRWDETFIRDFKTSRHRTKAEWQSYRAELEQSPQVPFYLIAVPEAEKLVYTVLSKKPATSKGKKPTIEIFEVECRRTKQELEAFQWNVHQVCEVIEFMKAKFGIERPWPKAIKLPVSPEMYGYRSDVYGRNIYTNELEGYTQRVEHLEAMRGK